MKGLERNKIERLIGEIAKLKRQRSYFLVVITIILLIHLYDLFVK